MKDLIKLLNAPALEERLDALGQLMGLPQPAPQPQYANNHIHTWYSFSPYSPASAVYHARQAGLLTAGIMDHDSIAGAREFIRAGEIAGVETTVGLECRVSVVGTPLEGRRVNNPDQLSVAYMALHGVPHPQIAVLQDFFAPYREARNRRNREMVKKINALAAPAGITLDFERDVLPISKWEEGGGVTERHLLYALALRCIQKSPDGLIRLAEEGFGIALSGAQREQLADPGNPFLAYDLLGAFKGSLVERIYVDAGEECMHISRLAQLARETGALLCYPYLGDVGDSVTGDKKTQKFEDDYLDLLFDTLGEWQVDAVTYMPSRNTSAQLTRLQKKCGEYGFFEISGEDINQPRQKFICPQLAQPQFAHLIDATHKLIDYEKQASLGSVPKPKAGA